jgi:phosphinothricin acetyltransferase
MDDLRMEQKMQIRDAEEKDMPRLTEIYNDVLISSTAIYRDTPVSVEERLQWFRTQKEKAYAVLVAEEHDTIVGYASYGDFRPWPGYRYTVEGSIHLRADARHKGTGTLLFQALLAHARDAAKHMLIAGVDSENVPSLRFLEKLGAHRAAHLREVGYKFGRYLDLILFQIPLS